MGISDGILEYWNGGMMGLGFRVQRSGFSVQGSAFSVQGSGFTVENL
jgi:hypothetical protein